jgi:hypothetical protein
MKFMKDRKVKIVVSKTCNADVNTIMKIISDWKDLPRYWYGMRRINRENDDILIVKFAFPGNAMMKFLVDGSTTEEVYTGGPFRGYKRLTVSEDVEGSAKITAIWVIDLFAPLRLARKRMIRHLTEGTEHALERIALAAERMKMVTD